MTIHRDAWDDAKEFGITETLAEIVRKSVKTDLPHGSRRHGKYFFVIDQDQVIGVNTEEVRKCDPHWEEEEVGGLELLHMTCPYCVGVGGACAVCNETRKVSGTKNQLISMLHETLS